MSFLKKHWIALTIVGVICFFGYLAYSAANNAVDDATDAATSVSDSLNPVNWIKALWAVL